MVIIAGLKLITNCTIVAPSLTSTSNALSRFQDLFLSFQALNFSSSHFHTDRLPHFWLIPVYSRASPPKAVLHSTSSFHFKLLHFLRENEKNIACSRHYKTTRCSDETALPGSVEANQHHQFIRASSMNPSTPRLLVNTHTPQQR